MRDEDEIKRVLLGLGWDQQTAIEDDPDYIPEVRADDKFQYGYLAGKVAALGWVLGLREYPSVDITSHYDYLDYLVEQHHREWLPPQN